jgi:hypothetical protein
VSLWKLIRPHYHAGLKHPGQLSGRRLTWSCCTACAVPTGLWCWYVALDAMATVCDQIAAGVGDSDSASASAFRLGAIDMLGVISIM